MTASWLLFAAALALVPLGSHRSLRLAALTTNSGGAVSLPRIHVVEVVGQWSMKTSLLAGVALAAVWGPALGAASGLGLTTATILLRMRLLRRSAMRAEISALAVVRAVHAEVEAGAIPADALAAAAGAAGGARSAELHELSALTRQSIDPVAAASVELMPLAQALRVSGESGAAAAPVLARVAEQLQAGLDDRDAVTAALAGARSSALLLAALPLVGLALGAGLGANPIVILFGTTVGHGLVLCGIALECAGLLWTARLAAGAEVAR